MASIFPRKNKDGSITWRMMIRRKGLPIFCWAFSTKKEATQWVRENEKKFIDNPDKFLDWQSKEWLNQKRDREFRK